MTREMLTPETKRPGLTEADLGPKHYLTLLLAKKMQPIIKSKDSLILPPAQGLFNKCANECVTTIQL